MKKLDVVYPSNFYAYQTPVVLDYVAAINGRAPAAGREEAFTYVDLGCGDGFTIVLLAAIYPRSRFVGVDLDPRHVAQGRALAEAGGVSNVELIEGDFSEWRRLDLPPAQYVALHGVWAWISDAMRAAVLDYVRERLRPGGCAYLGYNALPGWAGAAALRQFFLDWADAGDPIASVKATLQKLVQLKAQGAEFFKHNPVPASLLDEWQTKDIRYVAHEIFAPDWSPQAFTRVERQMREAGLAWVGSADLVKNFPQVALAPQVGKLVAAEKDPARAEMLRDYAADTRFRRDVFMKPGPALDRDEFETRPFGIRVPVEEAAPAVPLPSGRIDVSREPFVTMRRALAQGTTTIAELASLLKAPRPAVTEALQLLTLGWQVAPFARSTRVPAEAPKTWTVPLPLTQRLLDAPVEQDGFMLLPAPATGSALALTREMARPLLKRGEAPKGRLSKWVELGLIAPA